ncbi:MAG: AsmA family protein [Planctomycetota bacterium]|jgi:hypothetical protein
MELIVILLGEFLFAPFIAAMALVLEVIALGIGGVLDLVGSRVATDRSPARVMTPPVTEPEPSVKTPRRWARILVVLAASLAVVTCGFLLLLDLIWFEGTVRWALDRVGRTTGVQVACDSASGSLFGGRVHLDGVSIRKPEGPRTRCDLTVKSVQLQLSIWTLLNDNIQVDSLELKELHGSFTRLQGGPIPPRRRSAKAFEIQSLAIDDLDVQITDRTGDERTYRLTVASWRSEPLRSRWLPFDILFRTNCAGVLAGSDFEIRSNVIANGRETLWQASNLPGWYLANELSGPFGQIREGTVDVQVDDRWTLGEVTAIDSRWQLVFHGVRAEVPSDRPLKERLWHTAWVTALNKLGDEIPLEFRLTFDGTKLTTYRSPEAKGIWTDVGVAMVKKLLGVTVK